MRYRVFAAIAGLVVVGAVAANVARAQSAGLTCGGVPLTVQTAEPVTGFTGACLAPHITYAPQLPTVCYSPAKGSVTYGTGSTSCTAPAANVFSPYAAGAPRYDSFQTLMTCYPRTDGDCPAGSFGVSRSCCDYGANMISPDGRTASGLVNFQ